jgi:hypothetical protein
MRIPQNISKIALLYNNLSRTLKGLIVVAKADEDVAVHGRIL